VVERPISQRLAAKLEKSKVLSARLGAHVNELRFEATTKNRITSGCFDLTLEHHNAVIVLVEARLAACAFALLRVMYESHVRGVWFMSVANDNEVDAYQKLRSKPLDSMVRAINQHPDWKNVGYSKFQAYAKNILDNYVHTGYLAVSRRISPDAVEQVHDEDQEIEALSFADLFALCTTEQVTALSGDLVTATTFQSEPMELIREM
jgi:hypothetical protein